MLMRPSHTWSAIFAMKRQIYTAIIPSHSVALVSPAINTVVPQKVPYSKAGTIKRFGQKVAALGGIKPGKSQSHNKMVRYMGTVQEQSCFAKNEILILISAQLNELIICRLGQGNSLLRAEIEKRRIAEIDNVLSHNRTD